MSNSSRSPRAPGSTRQDVETPPVFLEAVRKTFGPLVFDLAAHSNNVCDKFFTKEDNSLTKDWVDLAKKGEWCWLNNPFSLSREFVPKCHEEAKKGVRILQLLGASFGSVYYEDHVWNNPHCRVVILRGRVPFIGYDGHGASSDCALLVWGLQPPKHQIFIWEWKKLKAPYLVTSVV